MIHQRRRLFTTGGVLRTYVNYLLLCNVSNSRGTSKRAHVRRTEARPVHEHPKRSIMLSNFADKLAVHGRFRGRRAVVGTPAKIYSESSLPRQVAAGASLLTC